MEDLDTGISERWMSPVVYEMLPGNSHPVFTLALRSSKIGETILEE